MPGQGHETQSHERKRSMSRLAHLALYTEASTANPLGVRPFNWWLQSPAAAPRSAPMMSGYFPAQFAVPTPGEITSLRPSANILSGLAQDEPPAPSAFQEFFGSIDPQTWQYVLLGGAAIALLFALRSGRKTTKRRRR